MAQAKWITSPAFTAIMTVISLAMLVKSFVVARRTDFSAGMFDLVIWAFMAATWVAALALRLRHMIRSRRETRS